ncbi:reverse transcriptase domain-containing protein, partial [Paraburkholderia sp. BR14374]|uniref:reverse transcriptase domain-containing protein n=1 Tax=Paraburkholderia sp. BR14374 TaxID=3237007 RepID=UPI0034CD401A
SRTIRTARSRTSGEYLGHFFFVFSIAPFSQEVEPPEIPGRFTRQRCWKFDWLVEFDIKAAFDQIDHGLLLEAVRKHIKEDWILMYIERWLTAPFETVQGTRLPRDRGTPQGGVVTPPTTEQTAA